MKNRELNINNLIELWKVVAIPFQGYFSNDYFGCSYIKDTQWPNRIWINKQPFSEQKLRNIKEKLGHNYSNCTLSLFTAKDKEISSKKVPSLKLKSLQYGMSLKLTHKFKTQRNIQFEKVKNKDEAKLWSNTFFSAFGYEISPKIVASAKDKIPFYLVYFEEELVGTIILFTTHNIAGIHSLGIIPKKRKQGFATEIMYHILNQSIDSKLSLATLQASEMAKGIYLKIGFSIDFIMENYHLK